MKTFVVGDIHGRCAQLTLLLDMLSRDGEDTLVFLGDLIDRGLDAPGCVDLIKNLRHDDPDHVVCLRGNHEQMLLDFIDEGAGLWLSEVTGGEQSYAQYTGNPLKIETDDDMKLARSRISETVPPDHIEFFRQMPFYYEDQYAIYVHAGLEPGKHPRDSRPYALLWTRDMEFYKHYTGKPCVFGHTPTRLLPLRGRVGRHGIYLSHSAIGIDTGYSYNSPLTCLSLPDFKLYQAFADGRTETHKITKLIPEMLRTMQKSAQ